MNASSLEELDVSIEKFQTQRRWSDVVRCILAKVELFESTDDKVEALIEAATVLVERANNHGEALKIWERVLELDPRHTRAKSETRALAEKRHDWKRVVQVMRLDVEHLDDASEKLDLLLEIAKISSERLRRPDACIEAWEAVLAQDESHPEALEQLAMLYKRTANWEPLARVLQSRVELLHQEDELKSALQELGLLLADKLNDEAASADIYRRLLAIDPDDRRAQEQFKRRLVSLARWDELETFFSEAGRSDELIRILEREGERTDVDARARVEALLRAARLWTEDKQRPERAIRLYERVLEVDPDEASAARALLDHYRESGSDASLVAILDVIAADERRAGREAQAIELLDEAARLTEDKLGELENAAQRYGALVLATDAKRTFVERYVSLIDRLESFSAGLALLEQALAKVPKSDLGLRAELEVEVASFKARLGAGPEAIAQLQQVIASFPAHTRALVLLCEELKRAERFSEIEPLYRERLEQETAPERREQLMIELAKTLAGPLKAPDKAEQVYRDLLLEGATERAWTGIAELGKESGNPALVAEALEALLIEVGDAAKRAGWAAQLARVCVDKLDKPEQALATLEQESGEQLAVESEAANVLRDLIETQETRLGAARLVVSLGELRGDEGDIVLGLEVLAAEAVSFEAREEAWLSLIEGDLRRESEIAAFNRACLGLKALPASGALLDRAKSLAMDPEQHRALVGELSALGASDQDACLRRKLLQVAAQIAEVALEDASAAFDLLEAAARLDEADEVLLADVMRLAKHLGKSAAFAGFARQRARLVESPEAAVALLLSAGDVYLSEVKDDEAAAEVFGQALDLSPQSIEAAQRLADLRRRQRNWSGLVEVLELCIDRVEESESRIEYLLELSQVRRQHLSDVEGAIQNLRTILEIDPSFEPAVTALESLLDGASYVLPLAEVLEPVYRVQGNFESMLGLYRRQLSQVVDPEGRLALFLKVADAEELGLANFRGAYEAMATALREELDPRIVVDQVERYAADLGAFAEVVELYESCAANFQDQVLAAELFVRAAHIASDILGDVDKASELYQSALRCDPAQLSALEALEQLFEASARFEELAQVLLGKGQAAEDAGQRREALMRAASIFEQELEDYQAAGRAYQLLLEAEPDDLEVVDKVIEMLLLLEAWDDVLAVYDRRIDLLFDIEEKKRSLVEIGIIYEHELGDLDRAIDTYQKMLEIDPADVVGMARLDALYQAAANWPELLSVLEQRAHAASSDGELTGYRFRIAEIWRTQMNEAPRALELYEEIFDTMGDHAPTKRALENMLQAEQEVGRVAALLQPVYESEGAWPAVAHVLSLRAAHEEDPVEKLEVLSYLAQVCDAQLGDEDRAFTHYLEALAIDPRSEVLLQALQGLAVRGDRFVALGDGALAEAHRQASRDTAAAVDLAIVAARAFSESDDTIERAVEAYELVLSLDASHIDAMRCLVEVHENQGRWEPVERCIQMQIPLVSDFDEELRLRFRSAQIRERCLGDHLGAIDQYKEILALAPDHEQARGALELMLAEGTEVAAIAEALEPGYRAHGDWQKLAFLREVLLNTTAAPQERVAQLRALADLYRSALLDEKVSFEWLQRALVEAPEDEGLVIEAELRADALDGWSQLANTYADIVQASASDGLRVAYGMRLASTYLVHLGDAYRAESTFRFVLTHDAVHGDALKSLEGIYRESDAHGPLVTVLRRRLASETDPEERQQCLAALGHTLAAGLGDFAGAVAAYEELQKDGWSDDAETLAPLKSVYAQVRDWNAYLGVLEREAQLVLDENARAELLAEAAMVCESFAGDQVRAVNYWRQVLELRGDTAEALNRLGNLYALAGNWRDLSDVLEREAAATFDDGHRVAVLADLARLWSDKLGRERNALEAWERVLDIDPAHFEALDALAETYRRKNMTFELADCLLRQVAAGDPERHCLKLADAYEELGRLYAGSELAQPMEAIEAYRSALEYDPGRLDVLEAIERLYVEEENWRGLVDVKLRRVVVHPDPTRALTEASEAADLAQNRLADRALELQAVSLWHEREPRSREVFDRMIGLFHALGKHQESVDAYLVRIDGEERASERAALLRELGGVYADDLGEVDGGLQALCLAWAERYDDPDTQAAIEDYARRYERWSEVLTAANEVLESLSDAHERIAVCLACARWYGQELAHPEYALPYYEQVLAIDANNLAAAQQMVDLYRLTQQWQLMGETLTRVVDLAPSAEEKANALLELGLLCSQQMQMHEQAEAYYAQALRLDANNVSAAAALEPLYEARGQWNEVKDMLERQVANQDPCEDWYDASLRLGRILETQFNDLGYAARVYEAAVVYKPTDLETAHSLERSLTAEQRWRELASLYDRIVENIPIEREQVRALIAAADLWREQFLKPDEAVQRLESALEIDPGSEVALSTLVEVHRSRADWTAALDCLSRRVHSTADRHEQARWYREMGAIARDGLGDVERALDAYLAALDREGDSEETLSALAEVYARLEDHSGCRDMLAELIRLSDVPEKRTQLQLRLARLLLDKLEDEPAALEVYQSILDQNPSSIPALEASRSIYAARCDWHAVARLLGEEAAAHEVPRHAARALVELGDVHQYRLGDESNAKRAYEEALALDESCTAAMAPLAEYFNKNGEFERAQGLLARLLPRLQDGEDDERRLELLKLQGRVATELGDAQTAASAYERALKLSKEPDLESQLGLARAKHGLEAWDDAFKAFQAVLVHFRDELAPDERAGVFFSLGEVLRAQGERRKALNMFEKALDDWADHGSALTAIVELYEQGQQWNQAIHYLERLVERAEVSAGVGHLLHVGELWEQKLRNPAKAAEAYERAVDLDPADHRALHKLLGVLQSQREWDRVIDTIQAIADTEDRSEVRAKYIYTAGVILRDELKRPDEALARFAEALDIDPDQLKPFEAINKLLTHRQDWKGLERAFRKMLHRIVGRGNADLEQNLWHNLGIIYRDRLENFGSACEAFSMATAAKPHDLEDRKILAELLESIPGKEDEAIKQHEAIIRLSPQRLKSYQSLYRLHHSLGHEKEAVAIAKVLMFLGHSDAEMQATASASQNRTLLDATRPLPVEFWFKVLPHPDEDLFLGKMLEVVAPAVMQLRSVSDKQLDLFKKHWIDPETSTVLLARVFREAASRLSIGFAPRLFARSDVSLALALVPGSSPPAVIAGSQVLSGRTPAELAFYIGMTLAYFRPERFVRTQLSSSAEIKSVLLAALVLAGLAPAEGQSGEFATQLGSVLQPAQREALNRVAKAFSAHDGGRADVKAWLRGVEMTAVRAGLVACGDVRVAATVVQSLPSSGPNDPPAAEKLAELLAFSISGEYFAAREALGL